MPYDPPIEPPAPTVREFEHAIHEISDALGCGCTVYDCTQTAAALRAEVERLTGRLRDAVFGGALYECDCPTCNCGGYHSRYARRMNEIADERDELRAARDAAQARLAALVSRLRGLFGVEKPFHIDGCRCVRCDVHDALADAQSGDGRQEDGDG